MVYSLHNVIRPNFGDLRWKSTQLRVQLRTCSTLQNNNLVYIMSPYSLKHDGEIKSVIITGRCALTVCLLKLRRFIKHTFKVNLYKHPGVRSVMNYVI